MTSAGKDRSLGTGGLGAPEAHLLRLENGLGSCYFFIIIIIVIFFSFGSTIKHKKISFSV